MHRPLRTASALVVATLVLALASCGSDEATDAGGSPASTTTPTPAPTTPDETDDQTDDQTDDETGDQTGTDGGAEADGDVPESLDFRATTVAGDSFDGASVAGRPVLLWFWAPWCPTCRGQIPQVQELAADHGSALTVLGVGSLDSSDAIADFAGDVDEITHLEDEAGELYQRFGITEQSSFVLLDADGEVAFQTGYGGSDALADEVAAVVG